MSTSFSEMLMAAALDDHNLLHNLDFVPTEGNSLTYVRTNSLPLSDYIDTTEKYPPFTPPLMQVYERTQEALDEIKFITLEEEIRQLKLEIDNLKWHNTNLVEFILANKENLNLQDIPND